MHARKRKVLAEHLLIFFDLWFIIGLEKLTNGVSYEAPGGGKNIKKSNMQGGRLFGT